MRRLASLILAFLFATALGPPLAAFDNAGPSVVPVPQPAATTPRYTDPYATPAYPDPDRPTTYSQEELLNAGHAFFGETSAGLSQALESLLSRFGEPNGYVLGEEASGAVFGGLRYGEGTLYTNSFGNHPIFWQGPSLGWDLGGSGSRVMMMVYQLPSVDAFLQRFTGLDGSAYLVGGVSLTVMMADQMVLVPVRTGVGARLGFSLGYLKFTKEPTWNPF